MSNAQSQPPAAPPEEKAKKEPAILVNVISQRDGVDNLELDPDSLDPDMHYRFFYDSGRRAAVARTLGYKVVHRSENGPRLISDDEAGAAEGLVKSGDSVLYECPKEKYEERRKKKEALSEARLSSPEGQFRKRARKGGAKVVGKDKGDDN